ncbi:MAG: hypothetical protein JNL43_00105 [Flavobacteriales bacterium]|nr:hypothetical protein [Flavobacteriales bacterium]
MERNLLATLLLTTLGAAAQGPPVIVHARALGGSGNDQLNALQPTADGGYIGVGQSGSNDGDVGSNTGADDAFIFKLDATGTGEV